MVVIGDPFARTNLEIFSNNIKILLTINRHILPQERSQQQHSDASIDGSCPSTVMVHEGAVMVSYENLRMKVSMPMYSGNDMPTAHQELDANINCSQIRIFSHRSFLDDVTGLSGLTTSNGAGLCVPNLVLNFHNEAKGIAGNSEGSFRVQTANGVLNIDCNELATCYILYHSWSHSVLMHSLISSTHSAPPPNLQSDSLSVQAFNCCFEFSRLPTETRYSFTLERLNVSLTSVSLGITLPILCCQVDTGRLLVQNGGLKCLEPDLSGIVRNDEDAVRICIMQKKLVDGKLISTLCLFH